MSTEADSGAQQWQMAINNTRKLNYQTWPAKITRLVKRAEQRKTKKNVINHIDNKGELFV